MNPAFADQLQLFDKLIADPFLDRRLAAEESGNQVQCMTARMTLGEEAAFREFHDQYFDRLYRYLIVVTGGDEQTALDLVQETLLRVTKYIRCFAEEDVFWSWLTVLARSAARDGARRRGSYLKMLAGYARGLLVSAPQDTAPVDAESELRACVNASLESLEILDRNLVEGKYFGQKSVKSLADETGLSLKAVESRLLRARKTIKQQILVLLDDERSK